MGKLLFLTSAGLVPETKDVFLGALNAHPKDLRVAFIPTAADPEEDKWFVKAARDRLNELGFQAEDVDLKDEKELVKNRLSKADIIYINGGNTFYLLEWVRKSTLNAYLKDLIEAGKIYIGTSAGSILLGPNTELAGWNPNWDVNIHNLQDLAGLNIVPFVISPHFTEARRAVLEKNKPNVSYEIIPITDKQAVLVKDSNFTIVGEGKRVKLL